MERLQISGSVFLYSVSESFIFCSGTVKIMTGLFVLLTLDPYLRLIFDGHINLIETSVLRESTLQHYV